MFDFFKRKNNNKHKEELTFDMLMSYNNCTHNDYESLFKKEVLVGKAGNIIMSDKAILRYTNGAILSYIKIEKGEIINIIICDNNLLDNFSVPVKFENPINNITKIIEEIRLRKKNQRDVHQNKNLKKLKEEENINNSKEATLTEEQLAFLEVINTRSISDWECKTQRGLTLDQVAAMHFQQYEEDEERIPKEDRKYVAGSRISSLNSLKTYIEEFGTEQQKFTFNSTVIASLLLTYTKISKYSDVVLFKLRKNHLMRNIETEMFSKLEETSKEYFAMLKKRAEEEQED